MIMQTKAGHIVILSNPSLQGLLKISYAPGSLAEMLKGLNDSTDLPTPYQIEKSFLIADPENAIPKVYDALALYRVSEEKNYFNVDTDRIVETIGRQCVKIGYLYILSNPGFREDVLRIGSAKKTLEERVVELNESDSVPAPFKIEAYFEVTNPEVIEEKVFRALNEFRISDKKFFTLNLGRAVSMIAEICGSEPKGMGIHEIIEDEEILEIDRTIRECDQAVDTNPQDRHAILERARAYCKLGTHEKAIADFDTAIALNPDDDLACVAHIERGQVYYSNGDYWKAITEFDRAMELGPDDEWACVALFTRGQVYLALGEYEKAVNDYTSTIVLKPDDEWICVAYIERGRAYYNLGEYQKAIDDYNKAIELNPDDEWASVAHLERGQVYYYLGDYEKAISDYDRTVELK
jgi:tetratricopeptide (TPR) repeat protein